MKDIKEIYPDYDKDGWISSDYSLLLESFGYEKLLQVDDNDYQGDSRVLYKNNGQYGFLTFGWGSCSGCDALQACNSLEEVDQLRKELRNQIIWKSHDEMLRYMKEHDWKGDYGYSPEFVEKSIEILEKTA